MPKGKNGGSRIRVYLDKNYSIEQKKMKMAMKVEQRRNIVSESTDKDIS
jgi:hypothetical protein